MIVREDIRLAPAGPVPRIEYIALAAGQPVGEDVLAAVVFGDAERRLNDPRCVCVGLESLSSPAVAEIWRGTGPVRIGFAGAVRYTMDEEFLAGAVELDEREYGGLAAAARAAYSAIDRFQSQSTHPHLLRMWNYFDGINRGEGDAERYKQFCLGRAEGIGSRSPAEYPAATAIGRRDGSPILQIYWLAGRRPGVPLENPRQVSAYRYPRHYGPEAPRFSRAMLVSSRLLMISGTASVIGHASHHPGDLGAQLGATLENLASLRHRAAASGGPGDEWSASTVLKIYLREREMAATVASWLAEELPSPVQYMILAADICRSELLIEIDCLHQQP